MKLINLVLVAAGLATLAFNASADPTPIVMHEIVITVKRPTCSAPRPLVLGSSERLDKSAPNGTVRVCEQGAL